MEVVAAAMTRAAAPLVRQILAGREGAPVTLLSLGVGGFGPAVEGQGQVSGFIDQGG